LKASSIRILVVDDFEPWRRFISSALSKESKLRIIGEVFDEVEAVQHAEELQPDLILLDIGLPSLNGIEAARRIRRLSPKSKILFISEHTSVDIVKEAMRAGGCGYVVKSHAGNDLLPALAAVLQGKQFASASLRGHFFAGTIDEQASDDPPFEDVAGPLASKNIETGRHHEVAFYPNDEAFVNGCASFAKSALDAENPVIVIATKPHRTGILRRLRDDGVDVDAAIQRALFIEADSVEVLSTFMEDGMPAADRVALAAKRLIEQAAEAALTEHSRIAICGELAPVLLAQEKAEAAILVERHFDHIARSHDLDLLCGYVLGTFLPERHSRIVERICAEHSAVHVA
jgi:DNA-binding NarL/FixJ family response regulator